MSKIHNTILIYKIIYTSVARNDNTSSRMNIIIQLYSPGGVDQGVPGLILVRRCRANVCDHDSPTITAQGLAKQSGEFAVTVVDESWVRASTQGVYTVSQCQQRSVYMRSLF